MHDDCILIMGLSFRNIYRYNDTISGICFKVIKGM